VPDNVYVAEYPPRQITQQQMTRQASGARAPGALHETPGGPASARLVHLLSRAFSGELKVALPPPELVDYSATGPSAGNVTYAFSDGSLINASQQQLPHPMPYSAVGVTSENEPQGWASGTQVVLNNDADFLQVILITKTGLMTQVTVRGVSLRGIAIPVTAGQLMSVAKKLDALIVHTT
jgi:hypothetical protein